MLLISARTGHLHVQTLKTMQCGLELFVCLWKLGSSTWLMQTDITTKEKEMMQIGIKTRVQTSGDTDFKLDFKVIKSTYSETELERCINLEVLSGESCSLGFRCWGFFNMYYC